ncbi:MAG TPA: amidase [Xanthomonadaceae bacterium]|nr:amidase [Xanthomonadaceae bacterium]
MSGTRSRCSWLSPWPGPFLAIALCACAPTGTRPDPAHAPPAAYRYRTTHELVADIADGSTTGAAVVRRSLDRIAGIDDRGPLLNAVTEIAPDVQEQAARLDAERAAGRIRGPLHGIPVLVKDNIDVAGMATTAGSLALADNLPPDDAFIVARMREAGLLILGKTNLSEWANFRSTRSISGWSARGGQTLNPHVLDRNPCGSSSGSAVAVAAGMATLAIGTETDGSIICPAAVNGIVGIKPTVGLVSRDGIVPIAPSQDTAGPMAASVSEAAMLLGVLAARDPQDPAATADESVYAVDYAQYLDPDALRGARIGVARNTFGFHSDVDRVLERAIDTMRNAGAQIVDPVELPTHEQFGEAELEVLLFEFKHALPRYLEASGAPLRTLEALIEFNRRHAELEMRWFGQELFLRAAGKGGLDDPAYVSALARAKAIAGPEGIDAAMDGHRLDAILTTATGPAWSNDPVNGDHFPGAGYSAAAVAGYPSITVPAGAIHGLPVGAVFVGRAWSEPRLVAIAYAFEHAAGAHRRPQFLDGVEQPR